VTKIGLSETLAWHARAAQARRIATMLAPEDAELIEGYAPRNAESALNKLSWTALDLTLVDRSHRDVYVAKLSNPRLEIFLTLLARQRPRVICVAVQLLQQNRAIFAHPLADDFRSR
jgi:hypothetical protein